jgi:hypothetical protein
MTSIVIIVNILLRSLLLRLFSSLLGFAQRGVRLSSMSKLRDIYVISIKLGYRCLALISTERLARRRTSPLPLRHRKTWSCGGPVFICASALLWFACLFLLFNTTSNGYAGGPKKIIHVQAFSTSPTVSSVVTNAGYIDTLPFDGIALQVPVTQTLLGSSFVANYTSIFNSMSPMIGLLKNVTHNYAVLMSGNVQMADPFDDWTQTILNWVTFARAARDAGMEGIIYDAEEYNVNIWTYPASVKYPSNTLSRYQEQWRLRGTQVTQAILAQWPTFKLMHLISPNCSTSSTPEFGSNNNLDGYFVMGMFAGAPGHVIDGGECYQLRSTSDFSFFTNFDRNTLSGYPISPPLVPSALLSTWRAQCSIAFGIYDQSTFANEWSTGRITSTMTPSLLQTTMQNAFPFIDEILWNYSESLDWLTPGAGAATAWIPAVWNARSALGIPVPGT